VAQADEGSEAAHAWDSVATLAVIVLMIVKPF